MKPIKKIKFSMQLTVISLFIALSLLIIAVALSLQYYFSHAMAKETSSLLFKTTAQNISDKVHSLDKESHDLLALFSQYHDLANRDNEEELRPLVKMIAQAMQQKPYLYAMYIGYENGNFYELINLESSRQLRKILNANADDRWIIVRIGNGAKERQREFRYYDADFHLKHIRTQLSDYYANIRPWYKQAMASDKTIKTAPYIFHNTQAPGMTYAVRIPGSRHVLAVDISLTALSDYLRQMRTLKESQSMIFDRDGNISAHSFTAQPAAGMIPVLQRPVLSAQEKSYLQGLGILTVSNERNWPPFDFSYTGEPAGYSVDVMNLVADKLGLKIKYSNGYNWPDLVSLYKNHKIDVLHSIFHHARRDDWGLFSAPYFQMTPVLVSKRGQAGTLDKLTSKDVLALVSDSRYLNMLRSQYPELRLITTDSTYSALNQLVKGQANVVLDDKEMVEYYIERYGLKGLQEHVFNHPAFGAINRQLHFLVHTDKPELQALFNKAIASITPAERRALDEKWLSGVHYLEHDMVPTAEFITLAQQSHSGDKIARDVDIKGTSYTVFVHHLTSAFGVDNYLGIMVPTRTILAPYMNKVYVSLLITLALLIALSPLLFLFAHMIVRPVKLLAQENQKIEQRRFQDVAIVSSQIKELSDLSSAMFSMAESIQDYQLKQQELMDAFIRLIAESIDEKSPYTGGHCARVPQLAIMLAQAAESAETGTLKDFCFASEEQRREFRTAAWLHDCGKVTTPEHIIDKATKLEANYNRIHEIRMRFEVLLRDTEIRYWQALNQGLDPGQQERRLLRQQQEIKDDFLFIARCNIGGEFMSDEDIGRVQRIASHTWTRRLDKYAGLSAQELKQFASAADDVNTQEHVLADLPEHLINWPVHPATKAADDIRMPVPDYQANLGEIYNLTIRRGTLTTEDRYRINEHIVVTIRMLESLPLPADLARLPEIAGGHHETLNGSGYPKKLTRAELSTEARILAIADVFEALTASDRPYKDAKRLSEAVHILFVMVQDQHLDMDLFKLFLTSGVYRTYGERFLKPEQCDVVDVAAYLARCE